MIVQPFGFNLKKAAGGVGGSGPSFVSEYVTNWSTATTPKTLMNALAINAGDILVVLCANAYASGYPNDITITENGAGNFVTYESFFETTSYCGLITGAYIATGSETITLSAANVGANLFGGNVLRFSGATGIGASEIANGSTGSPSITITTTAANSAIAVICADWNATAGTQTFTNNGGAGNPTAVSGYSGDGVDYGVAIAYYADAGSAGTKTVGMSAPAGQKWSISAIEVLA